MHTVQLLKNLVESHIVLAYAVIFLGLIFEGEVVLITTGILAHLGALSFWVALIFIIAGALCKAFGGYWLGGFLYKKWNHTNFFKFIEKRVFHILPRFRQKPFWSIFASKFIMGANYIVVLFSGYQKIAWKTYIKAEIISTLIWAPLLLTLGYFFSYTALHISREIWRFSLIIIIFIIAFLVFDKLVAWVYELFEELHDTNE